jgi:dCTP deaminase
MGKKETTGALPDHELRNAGIKIKPASSHKVYEISPASIDIPCGEEFYRLPGVMLPGHDETVADIIHKWGRKHSNSSPLEVGVTYAVPLGEVELPEHLYAYFNPKSSSGRVDAHCRVVVDKVSRYDTARPEGKHGGYRGMMWLLITSNSFPIMPPDNTALVQMRVFSGDTRFKQQEQLQKEWRRIPLAYRGDLSEPLALADFTMSDNDGTLLFTANFSSDDGIVGYSARKTTDILDLRLENQFEIERFFVPERAKGGEFLFAPGQFYLWKTCEAVNVPSHLAAELVAMDERIFEGRTHFAGYIDPGFKERVTLEIRCEGMLLRQGQPVGRIQFERLTSAASVSYSSGNHHYRRNTFTSKHFIQ